jgi:ArsR family transcriptional regulator, arsenate/arsenite/antimonite-responsive transcriptional repressor
MKSDTPQIAADLAFRAFSDRTRLRILHLLLDGELCVGDLVAILKTPQPTASRHLAYLRKARLVTTRNHGAWTFYALAPARSAFHKKLLACLAQCFTELAEIASDSRKAKQVKRSGGCCPR